MSDLEQTQQYLERHHGGDGHEAATRTQATYAERHNAEFWDYWQQWCAPALEQPGTLLDLGTGTGLFMRDLAQRYPAHSVFGVECAPYMLQAQVELPANTQLRIADLNDPPLDLFAPNSISLACGNMLIHELHQPVRLLAALRHWMRPGGRLLLVDIVRQPLAEYLDKRYSTLDLGSAEVSRADLEDAFGHFLEHNRYTADDLRYIVERCGWKIVNAQALKGGRQLRLVAERL